MIIIDQTVCTTAIGSLARIKEHGDNGMDYFGITARGKGISFSATDKDKSQRNDNGMLLCSVETKTDGLI